MVSCNDRNFHYLAKLLEVFCTILDLEINLLKIVILGINCDPSKLDETNGGFVKLMHEHESELGNERNFCNLATLLEVFISLGLKIDLLKIVTLGMNCEPSRLQDFSFEVGFLVGE